MHEEWHKVIYGNGNVDLQSLISSNFFVFKYLICVAWRVAIVPRQLLLLGR